MGSEARPADLMEAQLRAPIGAYLHSIIEAGPDLGRARVSYQNVTKRVAALSVCASAGRDRTVLAFSASPCQPALPC